jgi:aminopeptidase N
VADGELVDQHLLDTGYRVDVWSVQVPQTPARLGFAVGKFVLVGDDYVSPVGKRSQLIFAVEPAREHLLDATFAPTRDMLDVVERRTAVEYPFSEYKQVVVSGHNRRPTELAGLALISDFMLRDDRALLDGSDDGEIMRAIASQWFGSWIGVTDRTQLPLIHGFARLFQAFYREEEAGRLGLEEDLLEARRRYLEHAKVVRRPIIGVDTLNEVDAAVAEKSALALYQLGAAVGDELWWRAVRDFAARGGRRTVTIDDLREAMEQASRRTLTEYFDQWFFEPGHPELVVEHDYDAQMGVFTLRIRQTQDLAVFPTFDIDTSVSIHFETAPNYRERIQIASRDTTLRFGVPGRITFARLDDDDRLVAEIQERKPLEHWLNQLASDESVVGRFAAVEYLGSSAPSDEKRDALMRAAVEDLSSVVRARAINQLTPYASSGRVLRFLFDRSVADPDAGCRAAAIRQLDEAGDPSAVAVYRNALQDPSSEVVAAAVEALGRATPGAFWTTVEAVTEIRSWNSVVERSILQVLAETPDPRSERYLRGLLEPHNGAGVRVAALNTFRQLSSLGGEWETAVRSLAQSLLSDRNAEVRQQAREILEHL